MKFMKTLASMCWRKFVMSVAVCVRDFHQFLLSVLIILILMLTIAAGLYEHFTDCDEDSNDNSITSKRRSFHRSPDSTIM